MNACEEITNKLLELLETGIVPWRKPWGSPEDRPRNLISNRPYGGVNRLLLHCSPFASNCWLTGQQIKKRGAGIKREAVPWPILLWSRFIPRNKEGKPELDSEGKPLIVPFYRIFHVYNSDQCTNLRIRRPIERRIPFTRLQKPATVLQEMKDPPTITTNTRRACYHIGRDTIYMPPPEVFRQSEAYYSTLFHELIHSTGHAKRLSRFSPLGIIPDTRGNAYAREELIAEIGASFLCGEAGIVQRTIRNSAAYLKTWIERLRETITFSSKPRPTLKKRCIT